ncbi:uncharacterized protein LOC143029974 [Oratosquilla oratoria]|uniref:uncharacterized protein LOC143029974 n=1 Tax=Oratosquilla oratoria TaxID=337810 RepID=UPI003F7628E5
MFSNQSQCAPAVLRPSCWCPIVTQSVDKCIINELNIQVNDLRGKFIKPTLKKVSKYENKFAKLQKKAAEFNFRNQLKTVKKKEFELEDDKGVQKPDWAAAGPGAAKKEGEEGEEGAPPAEEGAPAEAAPEEPAETAPAEGEATEGAPAEEAPPAEAEAPPAEPAPPAEGGDAPPPAEEAPAEAAPAEAAPAEAAPAEEAPAEAAPAEAPPAEAPSEAPPAEGEAAPPPAEGEAPPAEEAAA